MADRHYDRERLKHLIHTVIWRFGGCGEFGLDELGRIVWSCDAGAFLETGQSITGASYSRAAQGPVFDDASALLLELARAGAIIRKPRATGGGWALAALAAPDTEWFSPDEHRCIDKWACAALGQDRSGSAATTMLDHVWRAAQPGEALPVQGVLAWRIRKPGIHELGRMRQRAEVLGLT